ncbi:hypothetical protein [Stutzerimonas kirkiae]|uniref:hypothetical protein n=1 Tax=Stutzerimonas kirkiae TaxID=2211392 RepID=UPI00103760F9|nr:hypothetical protein [Stutzerimonas kirkiae]
MARSSVQSASIKALEAGRLDEKHRLPRSFVQPPAFQRCFWIFAVHGSIALALMAAFVTASFNRWIMVPLFSKAALEPRLG